MTRFPLRSKLPPHRVQTMGYLLNSHLGTAISFIFISPNRGIYDTFLGDEGGAYAYLAELLPDTILAPPRSHEIPSLVDESFVNNDLMSSPRNSITLTVTAFPRSL